MLGEAIPNVGRARIQTDMDTWGYTFRLGSARAWFERDADDARAWLVARRNLLPRLRVAAPRTSLRTLPQELAPCSAG